MKEEKDMSKIALHEDELDNVVGGTITYTWDGTQGSLGIDGFNPYILVSKEKFIAYYNSVKGTMTDPEILRNLREQGIIRKP